MSEKDKPPALILMGPTASGKSALAVQLAQALNGEIISVDSALVYRGMDIGTAKPTLAEQQGIPHHLIDILDPAENFSTGQFRMNALKKIAEITSRGRLPILAGGTMLYFRALTQGIAELPEADAAVRFKLNRDMALYGKETLHQRLAAIDPAAAARIHPNDPQRIQRALEVYELTGKSLTSFFSHADQYAIPFRVIKLILAPSDRKILHALIAERFLVMLKQGFIDEVAALFKRGDLSEQMPSIRCVGYRQIWSHLKGECGREEMIEKSIAATRQLAKRQFTWLRKETEAVHFESYQPDLLNKILPEINSKL